MGLDRDWRTPERYECGREYSGDAVILVGTVAEVLLETVGTDVKTTDMKSPVIVRFLKDCPCAQVFRCD